MVNVGGALVVPRDDTTRVVHEDLVASGDSDVNGRLVERLEVLVLTLGLGVAGDLGNTLLGVVLAVSTDTSVSVVGLLHGVVSLEPVVGPEVPATRAALVACRAGAINELLLGHDDFLVASDHPGRLNGLDG